MSYYKYSQYLKEKYGEKVYKIPINLPGTCPNRDGACGKGGCVFCGEVGAGFEAQPSILPISEQMKRNIAVISPKYKANKFIAYFQNYTGTYMALDLFEKAVGEALIENVVGVSISTRPDYVEEPYLAVLDRVKEQGVDVEIELGLQSININTLNKINRGHGLAEFVDAVQRIKAHGFTICAHLIANLPWDTEDDFFEAGRLLSVLGVDSIKIHSLYILEHTELGKWYNEKQFDIISYEAYIDRVIQFLRIIRPDIAIQRLFARGPEEETLFCNWGMSWRKLQNMLDLKMTTENHAQGDLYKIGGGRL